MDLDVPELPRWLRAMFPDGMRRRVVDVGDGQASASEPVSGRGPARVAMHVCEWGSARGLPVVMVHGNPSWGFLYRKVVGELVERGVALRLIVPDLIGLGLSTKPRDPELHTLVQHGAWLGRMLDALELDQMILVVQDWGGPIAMSAARHRLDRVAALVILNTVLGPPRPGFKPTAFHRFARMPVVSDVVFKLAGFPQNVMAFAQGDRASILGKNLFGYVWPLRHLRDRAAPLALARMVPDSLDHPSVPELERCQEALVAFTGPIAMVWGDRDPILGRVIGHLERLLPRAEVTRTTAGHFLQEEVPGPIADAIVSVAERARAN